MARPQSGQALQRLPCGITREFGEHARRRKSGVALASATLSDSPIPKIAFGDFPRASSISESTAAALFGTTCGVNTTTSPAKYRSAAFRDNVRIFPLRHHATLRPGHSAFRPTSLDDP